MINGIITDRICPVCRFHTQQRVKYFGNGFYKLVCEVCHTSSEKIKMEDKKEEQNGSN